MVQIIGKLLDKFGDNATIVRDANDQAAQAIMANLTNHGSLLSASWTYLNSSLIAFF